MPHALFSESAKKDLLEAWLFIAEESIDAMITKKPEC